jgi:hypothetical protein
MRLAKTPSLRPPASLWHYDTPSYPTSMTVAVLPAFETSYQCLAVLPPFASILVEQCRLHGCSDCNRRVHRRASLL